MKKLIITESQYKAIKRRISEEIHPDEAKNEDSAFKTVLDGKRNVCFLSSSKNEEYLRIAKERGLSYLKVRDEYFGAYIVYNKAGEENAMILASIARKNNGYLPANDPQETYTIGKLLGYDLGEVKAFVMKTFPDYKFEK